MFKINYKKNIETKGHLFLKTLKIKKPSTFKRGFKCFNLPDIPPTKGKGGRWLIGKGGCGPVQK